MGTILKPDIIESSIIKPIKQFEEARKCHTAHYRLEAMRKAAVSFRDDMLAKPQARFYQSMGLIRVPYPTKYAFLNCNVIPSPFIHILNRVFIVQVDSEEGVKTILLSPSDTEANAETPYFRKVIDKAGPLKELVKKFLAPEINTLEGRLDQYISMVVEKTIAGNHPLYTDFPNMANSSELTSYWGFPGYRPTVTYGDLSFGTVHKKK